MYITHGYTQMDPFIHIESKNNNGFQAFSLAQPKKSCDFPLQVSTQKILSRYSASTVHIRVDPVSIYTINMYYIYIFVHNPRILDHSNEQDIDCLKVDVIID